MYVQDYSLTRNFSQSFDAQIRGKWFIFRPNLLTLNSNI